MAEASTDTGDPPKREGDRVWPSILAFAVLSILNLVFWRLLEDRERSLLGELAAVEARNRVARIEGDLRMRVAAVERMASRWERRGGTPRDEFLADAQAYIADLGGFQALEWVDAAFTVRWVYPLEGNEAALGLRMDFEETRRRALEEARRLGTPSQSPPVELVQGGLGFLLYTPLSSGGRFDGFIIGILRLGDWLTGLVADSSADMPMRISIGDREVFRQAGWDEAVGGPVQAEALVRLESGELRLNLRLGAVALREARSILPELAAAAGLLFAGLVGLIVRLLGRVSAKARGLEEARGALAASERVLAREVELRSLSLDEAHRRLLEQSLLRHDMATAGQVQTSLMSAQLPDTEAFEFAFRARPSRSVSGDFFDCQASDATHLSLVLADIAGKGLSAALLAASARSLYRLILRHSIRACEEMPGEPSAILEQLNDELFADLELAERFITMQAARLDLEGGSLEIANAGACPPVRFDGARRTGVLLEMGSLPLGIQRSVKAEVQTLALRPGEGVLFYSDGLSEAESPEGRLFGEDGVLAICALHAHLGAEALADALMAAVDEFRGGAPLSDDATLLLLKAKPRRQVFETTTTREALDAVPLRIAALCRAYGQEASGDMELAVSEALSNIREHGYAAGEGPLRVDLRLETRGIELVLTERGRSFQPGDGAAVLPEPEAEGGRGLFLIRSVMDHFSYEAGGPDGNRWLFFRAIES